MASKEVALNDQLSVEEAEFYASKIRASWEAEEPVAGESNGAARHHEPIVSSAPTISAHSLNEPISGLDEEEESAASKAPETKSIDVTIEEDSAETRAPIVSDAADAFGTAPSDTLPVASQIETVRMVPSAPVSIPEHALAVTQPSAPPLTKPSKASKTRIGLGAPIETVAAPRIEPAAVANTAQADEIDAEAEARFVQPARSKRAGAGEAQSRKATPPPTPARQVAARIADEPVELPVSTSMGLGVKIGIGAGALLLVVVLGVRLLSSSSTTPAAAPPDSHTAEASPIPPPPVPTSAPVKAVEKTAAPAPPPPEPPPTATTEPQATAAPATAAAAAPPPREAAAPRKPEKRAAPRAPAAPAGKPKGGGVIIKETPF